MTIAFLIGRIIAGLFYIYTGVHHFTGLKMMAGYAGSKGVPAPKLVVAGAGVLLIIGGLSIILGFQPLIGIAAIVLFFIGVTPVMHNFWTVPDPQHRMNERINFTKNLALLGSTLMFLAIPRPWPFGLGY
jgi:putative oxidoreductase